MPQQLRVVDNERLHPRDAARKAIEYYRALVDEGRQRPICNQTHSGAPKLFVDETIKRTEREMQDELRPRYHVNPYFALFLILASVIGLIKLFISIL